MAILGIDEVGRGPWAGPLVVGAVILGDATADWCQPLADSKKLTPKRREVLAQEIQTKALATATGWVTSAELDELGNLVRALELATRRAVEAIQKQKIPFHEIIIDGNINFLRGTRLERYTATLVKGDALIKEISAASIIAKVARDRYMVELGAKYPGYGFEKHMGYGTALHQRALRDLGPCPEHRQSFRPVRTVTEHSIPAKDTTKQLGDRAESVVADYLVAEGHTIIARNHKTKFYEIDIISAKDDHIYFTEVKYRKDGNRGTPLEAITADKLRQMAFAAESFLKFRPSFGALHPLLAAASVSGPDFHLDQWFPLDQNF